jgi:hypothetical protein
LVFSAFITDAQPNLPEGLQRYHLGYSYVRSNARMKYHYSSPDMYGKLYDTSVNIKMPSKGGFGVTMGTYIKLAQIGKSSNLNLGLDGVFNLAVWDMEAFTGGIEDEYLGPYYTADYVVTAGTLQYGMTATLDLKTGCDAMLDKTIHSCFTFGAGAYPSFAMTTFMGLPGFSKLRVQPVLKAEMGFCFGVCMKARILYMPGTFRYMGYNDITQYYDESFSLESKGSMTISLLIMPFSFAWQKGERWIF